MSQAMINRNIEKIVISDANDPQLEPTVIAEDTDIGTIELTYHLLEAMIEAGRKPRAEIYYQGKIFRIGFKK